MIAYEDDNEKYQGLSPEESQAAYDRWIATPSGQKWYANIKKHHPAAVKRSEELVRQRESLAKRRSRTAAWYRNTKELAKYRKQLEKFYQSAAAIPAEEILRQSKGVQYQYELLMTAWKRVQMILDTLQDLHASETRQQAALELLKGITA